MNIYKDNDKDQVTGKVAYVTLFLHIDKLKKAVASEKMFNGDITKWLLIMKKRFINALSILKHVIFSSLLPCTYKWSCRKETRSLLTTISWQFYVLSSAILNGLLWRSRTSARISVKYLSLYKCWKDLQLELFSSKHILVVLFVGS